MIASYIEDDVDNGCIACASAILGVGLALKVLLKVLLKV